MFRSTFLKIAVLLPIFLVLSTVFLINHGWLSASPTHLVLMSQVQPNPSSSLTHVPMRHLLNGKAASLGWIVGSDCQRGMQAYLQTADTNPDAALVGTGWVNPTDGTLIRGQSNSCVPGSLSMDNVVQLVHSKGGMAYLTITMDTEDPGAWTARQEAEYIDKATTTPSYIDTIVHEVMRAHYDGVIMDLEEADSSYSSIQQLFATYNQHVWAALQPLHKLYGIALIHKVSDRDDFYKLNGFQDWRLLEHTADFLVIMAVDQSYFLPGPAVSTEWLKQMVAYAMQTMPDMLPNIIWELPLYGDTWHWDNGKWYFDHIVSYQDAQALIAQLTPDQIHASSSDLQSIYTPHVVYTDTDGVKRTLWYLTPQGLYNIIVALQQILQQEPQFAGAHLQVAFWWRTTLEPYDFWHLLNSLY